MSCDDKCSSGISLPSFDDDLLRMGEDPPTQTHDQYYEPRSPRSNGYLESIFCPPPKIVEGSDDCSMQGESSLGNGENLDPIMNQDTLGDTWVEKYDKDQYALKDTLFSIIYPFFPH